MPRRKNSESFIGATAPDSERETSVEVQLSESQQHVLVELTLGKSICAAATAAGVHRGTVHRWMMDDPLFIANYHSWQSETRSSVQSRILAISDLAVDNVCDAVRKGDARISLLVLKSQGLLTSVKPGSADPDELARERDIEKRKKEAELKSREDFADMG